MAKKCIPGVICIENMTLAILLFLFIVLAYLYYVFLVKVSANSPPQQIISVQSSYPTMSGSGIQGTPNIVMDPYAPPVRTDGLYFPTRERGIPVNIETRGLSQEYTQMGILTRTQGGELILPIMGRRLLSGLDKWQYYSISNTGAINTKLPISIKGRSCSGEYGCDPLMSGDIVYVEGYKDTFSVTLYDTARFQYIPYI
jgi:hypothetical protein